MISFRYNFKIEIDQPIYKIVRLLEENIDTEKKFLWPWQKKPFWGAITGNGFKVTRNSYLTQYKPVVCGKLQSSQNCTLMLIQIRQTSLFYLAVFFGILFISGGFLLLDGASLENIIAATVVAAIYYSICVFFFFLEIRSTKKKLKIILFGDNK